MRFSPTPRHSWRSSRLEPRVRQLLSSANAAPTLTVQVKQNKRQRSSDAVKKKKKSVLAVNTGGRRLCKQAWFLMAESVSRRTVCGQSLPVRIPPPPPPPSPRTQLWFPPVVETSLQKETCMSAVKTMYTSKSLLSPGRMFDQVR